MPVTVDAPAIKTSKNRVAMRLAKAVKHADRCMAPFRSDRLKHLKQFAGAWYGSKKSVRAEPLNLVFFVVQALFPSLSINISISSKNLPL